MTRTGGQILNLPTGGFSLWRKWLEMPIPTERGTIRQIVRISIDESHFWNLPAKKTAITMRIMLNGIGSCSSYKQAVEPESHVRTKVPRPHQGL